MTSWRSWRTRLILFLAVLGPGFITANVDNDAGGILTYSQAGAQFGYTLLWTMIPITLALIVVQEMCARMGVVTGKGLSDLIREEFGLRMTFVIMILLVIVNFTNVITEFSGIAGCMQLFHVTKYISVPICALIVWAARRQGRLQERRKNLPHRQRLLHRLHHRRRAQPPRLAPRPRRDRQASPAQRLVRQSLRLHDRRRHRHHHHPVDAVLPAVLHRRQRRQRPQYKASRLDVIVGSIFTDIVAWFIIVACAATLYTHGMRNIADPSDAAQAMKPLAGDYAFILFAAGLFNASLFAASILPLSTAYTVCEGLGFESGLDKSFREAKFFYWLYSLLLFAGAAIVLIPNFPLVKFSILSQVLNGVLLPLVLVFMLKLINKHELMGKYTNSRWFNIIAWVTAIIVTGLSLLVWNTLHG